MVMVSQQGKTEEKKPIEIKLTEQQQAILGELKEAEMEIKKKQEELMEIAERESKPRKVDRAFFKSQKAIPKLMAKIRKQPLPIEKELEEPILILMKENGYADIIEGVKAGEFIIETPKGEKGIILTPDKLTTLKYGGEYYKTWIAYENCMSPYPENPIHSAEMYRKTTQKLAMNWRDRDESELWTAKTKFWLYVIGGLAIGAILFISTPFGKELIANIGKQTAETAVQTIQQNLSNVTQAGTIAISG